MYTWSISLLWLLWLLWLLRLLQRHSSSVAHPCPALMSATCHVDVYLLLLPLPLPLSGLATVPGSCSRFPFPVLFLFSNPSEYLRNCLSGDERSEVAVVGYNQKFDDFDPVKQLLLLCILLLVVKNFLKCNPVAGVYPNN